MSSSQVAENTVVNNPEPREVSCTVCQHPDRDIIDGILAAGSIGRRTVANRFGLTDSAVQRHRTNHLTARMVKAVERREIKQDDEFLDGILSAARAGAKGVSHGMAALDDGLIDPELAYRLTPAFMAQQLRALELLGQATGRLTQAAAAPGGNVYLSVIIPRPARPPASPALEVEAIDCTPAPGVSVARSEP